MQVVSGMQWLTVSLLGSRFHSKILWGTYHADTLVILQAVGGAQGTEIAAHATQAPLPHCLDFRRAHSTITAAGPFSNLQWSRVSCLQWGVETKITLQKEQVHFVNSEKPSNMFSCNHCIWLYIFVFAFLSTMLYVDLALLISPLKFQSSTELTL